MKAVVITAIGGPDVLQYQDRPDPSPGEGEVLIKTEATSVNFADILMREGRYHAPVTPPMIPGLDVTGTVVDVGPGVNGIQPGQRVSAFCAGSYAEHVVSRALLTWPVPDGVEAEQAAAFPTLGITSYNLLSMVTRIQEGDSVLIHAAAGGIGTTAVQLAKLLGAGTVIGTVGSDEKRDLPAKLGCDHLINYREEDFSKRVMDLTDGRGVDIILDSVAGPSFAKNFECLAPFGRVAVFGIASGEPGHARTDQLHGSNRAVLGYSSGHYRHHRPEALRPAGDAVMELLRSGKLNFVIGSRFPLRDAAAAHELVESRQSTGKVLLFPE